MRSDTIFGIAFAVLGILIFGSTVTLPERLFDYVGPRLFPQVVGVLMFVLAVGLVMKGKKPGPCAGSHAGTLPAIAEEATAQVKENDDREKIGRRYPVDVALLALCAAFVVILPKVGFLFSTVLFLVASMVVLGGHRRISIPGVVILAILLAGSIYLCFVKILGVILP